MILITVLGILAYLIFNSIVTLMWIPEYRGFHKAMATIVLMLFGLPITIIAVFTLFIMGISEVVKHEQ